MESIKLKSVSSTTIKIETPSTPTPPLPLATSSSAALARLENNQANSPNTSGDWA